MYIPYPQFEYWLSLFYLNLCLLSQLRLPLSLLWNTGPYLLWAQHQSWSQSLFELRHHWSSLTSLVNTDNTDHHRQHRSKSDPHSGTTLTRSTHLGTVLYVLHIWLSPGIIPVLLFEERAHICSLHDDRPGAKGLELSKGAYMLVILSISIVIVFASLLVFS